MQWGTELKGFMGHARVGGGVSTMGGLQRWKRGGGSTVWVGAFLCYW